MTVVSDNFNRANETPLAGNWSQGTGNFYLTSNAVVVNVIASDAKAVWKASVNPIGADQFAEAVLTETSNNSGVGPGLCLRADEAVGNNGTMYRIVFAKTTSNIEIGRFNAASYSGSLKTITQAWNDGDTWLAYIAGYVITLKLNGVAITTYDDSASGSKIATGQPGITYSSTGTTPTIDNWRGGDGDGSPIPGIQPGTKTWQFPSGPLGGGA